MIKTSFRHRNKSKNALVPSPLFLLLSSNPFHMNISHLLLCTSLLSAPVCTAQGPTEIETETPASSSRLPAPLAQKIASGDFDGLQTELRSTLLKAGEQTKSEQKLLQNRQYRHLLDMHELLRVTGPDKVKAVFSKSAQDAAFIKTFLQDPAWMELYLGAGLIPENSPAGLQILSDIWKTDGKSPDFRNYQSLATGLLVRPIEFSVHWIIIV